MRKIVRRYPVRRLPADLQEGFSIDALVDITIETEAVIPGMVVEEKVYEFRDEQTVPIAGRSFRAQ